MPVLIVGSAGFVGKNIINALKKKDIDFVASDITDSVLDKGIKYVKLDMTKREDVFNVFRDYDIDYVFHLAAHPLSASLTEPTKNAIVNIIGSLNLMDASREFGVRKFVFSSASSIVGEVVKNPVSEDHPYNPKTPYAVAKLSVEHYLRVYQELYGLDYVIFRFFNVYGPYQYPNSGALIPVVIDRIVKGREVYIYGDGSTARDFIYVGDLADFYIETIKRRDIKNEVFNMGTGKLTTVKEIIELIAKIVGKEPKIVYKPKKPGEITNFSADVVKLKKFFGEVPKTTLEEGLKKTYEWFQKEVMI